MDESLIIAYLNFEELFFVTTNQPFGVCRHAMDVQRKEKEEMEN
jgi:hypothetical protein